MIRATDKPSEARTIAIAVVTAALTTAATSLVTWAIDELKARRANRGAPTGDPE